MRKTFAIILDYCGGSRTDRLYEKLAADNPDYSIHMLDNASPRDRSRYATHHNPVNTYIGGGIRDSIALAAQSGCPYLFFLANDVRVLDRLPIAEFERFMDENDDVVQISAGLSADSDKVQFFPYMRSQGDGVRAVPHADILACLLRLSFIEELGGLPESKAGWGYDLDIAYHAHRLGRRICVADRYPCEHASTVRTLYLGSGVAVDKFEEMQAVYRKKFAAGYEDFARFYRSVTKLS